VATVALEMIGPMPGTVITRPQPASLEAGQRCDFGGDLLDALIEPAPVGALHRLSIAQVVLVTLDERLGILGRHQSSVVIERDQPALR
jgi:hypothetical protein